ncbi:MAG: serine/threonine-protein kinase [Acidobacteriota bacterium]|nr:serine/threonine-protein kinase [Acidobacteriota bacterium]
MTPERWRITEEILLAAWDVSPESREALLTARCAGDAALLDEVRSLLEAQQEADGWTAPQESAPATAGERRIGPYRLERLIGRGGMGAVYLAHRADEAFHQKVAIKVIGLPFELEPFRERFRRERQILAGLNHPNITHLIDGGVTADGELYLAMEYVEGLPLDEYCRVNNLTEAERLRMFRLVCGAVVYAHQNLIVHRDIKPSNILVSGDGVPKLLDFGTAKLLTEEAGLEEITRTGMGLITAAYASPEQLRGEAASTLSDVYSLGVLLYELASGERAFTTNDPRRMELDRAPELPRPLRGDLDRIVRKALAPDPAQRYSSVEQLSEDVRRFLDGEPVIAHPPSLAYRTRKFVRRHAWSAALAALFAVGLAAAAAFSLWQARVARRQADRAEKINAFLVDMLNSPNPSWYNTLRAKGKNVTVLDVLNELRGRIGRELGYQPSVEVEMRRTIGRMYSAMGQHQEAREQLGIALKEQLALTGRYHPDTGRIYYYLAAENYFTLHPAEAVENARASVDILEKAGRKQDRQALAEAYNALSVSLGLTEAPPSEIESAMRRSIELSREVNPRSVSTTVVIGVLGTFLLREGRLDEASRLSNEAMALYRARPGPLAAESFGPLRDLGTMSIERKDYAGAKKYLQESLQVAQDNWGPASAYTIGVRAVLALATGLSGQAAQAEEELKDCIRQYAAIGGSAELQIAQANEFLGVVQMADGKLAPAEDNLRAALASYRQHARKDDIRTAMAAGRLGECLLARNKREEALPLLTESYQKALAALGPGHLWTKQAQERLSAAR